MATVIQSKESTTSSTSQEEAKEWRRMSTMEEEGVMWEGGWKRERIQSNLAFSWMMVRSEKGRRERVGRWSRKWRRADQE
jgi:hypothetical protein